ncbi:MAG: enoyl-CoA hydratase/isomerase family protein, partial [Gemmobacter sp.]|uniref:enoyl-CoA hydratase-related protein n=1 Tax=Gemmobacter sp. TaxID=1898957 RepID=UPI001A439642
MADQAARAAAQVHRKDRDGLAWLELDAPPLNALSQGLRAALWQAVEGAEADPAVRGLVISAAGRSFPVGADIAELDLPPQSPGLPDLCDRIEACTKPVVAALHGTALGGGLELALAAHGRVALATTRLGLPEVTLGLLPGAGGTQRLPRLIGAEQALRLMLTGRPVPAAEALALGLLDRVVEGGLAAAAVAEIARLAALPALPRGRERREGLRDGLVYQRVVAEARRGLTDHRLPAPMRIVECVEAAQLLPFEAGRAFEAAAFDDLLASPESAALRHVFRAERRAARFAEARQSPLPLLPALRRVGVQGAAQAELALPLLQAGLEVVLVDPNRARLVQGLELLAARQEQALAEGRLTPAARDAEWGRLGSALGAAALAECGAVLVAEASLLPEAMEATAPGCL